MTRHKLAPAPADARQMKGTSVVVLLEADLVFHIGLVAYGAICINILIATAIFKRQGPKTKVTKHRKLCGKWRNGLKIAAVVVPVLVLSADLVFWCTLVTGDCCTLV